MCVRPKKVITQPILLSDLILVSMSLIRQVMQRSRSTPGTAVNSSFPVFAEVGAKIAERRGCANNRLIQKNHEVTVTRIRSLGSTPVVVIHENPSLWETDRLSLHTTVYQKIRGSAAGVAVT